LVVVSKLHNMSCKILFAKRERKIGKQNRV
jgi:hypothetical protein